MRFLVVLSLSAWLASRSSEAVAEPFYRDPNDSRTLLSAHLVNRQLNEQARLPAALGRAGLVTDSYAVASDLAIGTQQTLDGGAQTRFHGFYVVDSFAWARLLDGLEGNLNLSLYNPSASDGYRVSSQVSAGFALHAKARGVNIAGESVDFDLVGPDIDRITIGQGLLLEQIPCEGLLAGARGAHWDLDAVYLGRALWPDDDVISIGLGVWARAFELRYTAWTARRFARGVTVEGLSETEFSATPKEVASYVSATTELPLFSEALTAGIEYAVRVRNPARSAFLLRLDFLEREWGVLAAHIGYQLRWYQAGFGPRASLLTPSRTYNLPAAEDAYVTNSFEFFALSEDFEQLANSWMAEVHTTPWHGLELFGEVELIARTSASRTAPPRVVYAGDDLRAPGRNVRAYHRSGLRWYPWEKRPHRISLQYTNKQVNSGLLSSESVVNRFTTGKFVVAQVEAFL